MTSCDSSLATIGVILETGDGEDDQQQLTISEVFPGSPAAKAGLEDGDVVVKVEGRRVSDPREVTWRVHRAGMEGDTLLLEVQRDESTHAIEVRPEAQRFGGRCELRTQRPSGGNLRQRRDVT